MLEKKSMFFFCCCFVVFVFFLKNKMWRPRRVRGHVMAFSGSPCWSHHTEVKQVVVHIFLVYFIYFSLLPFYMQ